ncbi:hypothetical protein AURDEDRAFT_114356 [Auricularia subglabra TFB-10046 SS5]|nr:hypothetical protein AURDEDRAFT_114356 [Auricularia subglabra TFB-10046 SS5]
MESDVTRTLVTVAQAANVEKTVYAAVAAFFIYDFVITIGDEMELIWPSGFSVTEVLYYAARYTAWLEVIEELAFWYGNLDRRRCQVFGGYHAFSVVFGMVMSQSLIIVRTWAIWNGKRSIKIAFILFCSACLAICAYLSVEWMNNTTFYVTGELSPVLRGCAISNPYIYVYVGWIMFCCSDMTLLALTAVRCWQHLQPGSARLTVSLYRDAFAIFFIVLMLAIANLVVTLTAAEHYQVLLYGVERMLYTILACRMMLNLRANARNTVMPIGAATTGQTIDFNHAALQDQYELSSPNETTICV